MESRSVFDYEISWRKEMELGRGDECNCIYHENELEANCLFIYYFLFITTYLWPVRKLGFTL